MKYYVQEDGDDCERIVDGESNVREWLAIVDEDGDEVAVVNVACTVNGVRYEADLYGTLLRRAGKIAAALELVGA